MIALKDRTRLTDLLTIHFIQVTMEELVSIKGTVEDIAYQNSENGYTVLDFSSDGDYFVAVGVVGNVYIGENLTLSGEWTVHPTYGKQFKIDACARSMPETAQEMLSYLSSGAIKGIRERLAQRIINRFGEKTFWIIENEPDRLAEVKGISKEKATNISREFSKLANERNLIIQLEKYGINTSEALKIYKVFGSKAVETTETNPYLFCNSDVNMNFERANAIAEVIPNKPLDSAKYSEGIVHILRYNLRNGHTCIPRDLLFAPAKELLDCSNNDVDITIDNLIENKRIIECEFSGRKHIFLPELYRAETSIANAIGFISRFVGKPMGDLTEQIESAQLLSGVCFNDKQCLAIKLAVEKGILILTGGPGTGKTTTLRGILKVFEDLGLEVELTAPTGRAAKRMSELTGKEASTIHRLLEVNWDENEHQTFNRNKTNPLNAQAVIVDELSMVDVQLFAALLEALPIGCRLIMVGDSDQLPPVGAGNVLHDLINSKTIPVVELTEVFRQAMESMIITNAHAIVHDEMPELNSTDKDFFFLHRPLPKNCADTILELYKSRLPEAYNYNSVEDIQVLCPSRKGDTGTIALNKTLQEQINPKAKGKKEHTFGSRIFRVGDKVMQIKNNYNIEWTTGISKGVGVFNGDIGVLQEIDEIEQTLEIRFDDKIAVIPFEFSSEIEHAYAITVHKSQGSEFRCVIMPVTGINPLLVYRNLLYTAVTRARELIILVGNAETVEQMVNNNKKQKRFSALRYFMVSGA